jgi:hypothetical protein
MFFISAHSLRAGFLTSAARRGASVLPALVAFDRERPHAVRGHVPQRHRLDRSLKPGSRHHHRSSRAHRRNNSGHRRLILVATTGPRA